jgi:hypothetical protein
VSEFEQTLEALRQQAQATGTFAFRAGDTLTQVIAGARVPACAGVYVIHTSDAGTGRVVYIGKSGTVHTDGSLGKQRMNVRLCKKQGGMCRQRFFAEFMKQHAIGELRFLWIATYCDGRGTPPFLAEAQLLAAYLSEHGQLPELNSSA